MKLKYALKSIVEEEGIEILNDIRIINILSDYKSFDEIPASKHIIKLLIVDEYMKRIIGSEGASQRESIYHQFVTSSGFQAEYVTFVFNCIIFALGYQDSSINDTDDLSPSEIKRRSLEDIVIIDESSMIEKGISISNVFIEYSGKKSIHITFEVSKANDNNVNLFMVIFDKKERARSKEYIDIIWFNEHLKYMNKILDLPVPRTNMSKLLLTAN